MQRPDFWQFVFERGLHAESILRKISHGEIRPRSALVPGLLAVGVFGVLVCLNGADGARFEKAFQIADSISDFSPHSNER